MSQALAFKVLCLQEILQARLGAHNRLEECLSDNRCASRAGVGVVVWVPRVDDILSLGLVDISHKGAVVNVMHTRLLSRQLGVAHEARWRVGVRATLPHVVGGLTGDDDVGTL